jgi:hypothetical protein
MIEPLARLGHASKAFIYATVGLLILLYFAAPGHGLQASLETLDFVPIGVRYDLDPDPTRRRTDLENMHRLRFTVIAPGRSGTQPPTFARIDRLLAGSQDSSVTMPESEIGTVPIDERTDTDSVREAAWTRLASGARAVIFEDWKALQKNDTALGEAAAFAETLARNPALYVPLRRVESTGDRAFTIDGGQGTVEAHWLESPDALLLIALNHAVEPRDVTLTFAPAIPEAIWQNMLTGSAVNFVAGPKGPIYTRTFAAHDVLVLMIRKRWK